MFASDSGPLLVSDGNWGTGVSTRSGGAGSVAAKTERGELEGQPRGARKFNRPLIYSYEMAC
jgi:hypothetical protein